MPARIPVTVSDFTDAPEKNSSKNGLPEANWGNYQNFDISDIQFRAIQLTVNGMNDKEISATLAIDRKTLWRWKSSDEDYRAALSDIRYQLYAAFVDRCQNHLVAASNVLAAFLSESPDEKNRLRAAQILMQNGGRYLHLKETHASRPKQFEHDNPEPDLEPKIG